MIPLCTTGSLVTFMGIWEREPARSLHWYLAFQVDSWSEVLTQPKSFSGYRRKTQFSLYPSPPRSFVLDFLHLPLRVSPFTSSLCRVNVECSAHLVDRVPLSCPWLTFDTVGGQSRPFL